MSRVTTVWTLNRAYDLLAGTDQAMNEVLDKIGHDRIKFGQRKDTGNSQLMPPSEYFVPAAPKCIGRYFESKNYTLNKIRQYYMDTGQDDYRKFWDASPDRAYFMKTDKYQGYYEILERSAPNILIGYGQGGFVARYLLWLDRVVFKKNVIKGIIAVQSPLAGSPLANSENIPSLIEGALELILLMCGIDKTFAPHVFAEIEEITFDSDMEDIRAFLLLLHDRLDTEEHLATLADDDRRRNEGFKAFLLELYDWSGGLRDDPNNAFFDYNIFRMEKNFDRYGASYSAMASIHRGDTEEDGLRRISFGISARGMDLGRLLYESLGDVLASLMSERLSRDTLVDRCARLCRLSGFDLREETEKNLNRDNKKYTRETIEKINHIYRLKIMNEKPPVPDISDDLILKLLKRYREGIQEYSIRKNSNDLIIPTVYQLVLDNSGEIMKDHNFIHASGSHLAGAIPDSEGGRKNREIILGFLQRILL